MASRIDLPYHWKPRLYQKNLWQYLAAGGKRAVACWHRRSGKDDVFLHHLACAAHERVGNYWYMLPEYAQARKSMWDAVNPKTGKRRIDEAFPPEIRRPIRENEMMVPFNNGSTFQLIGSDNFHSLVGSPPVGLVMSEYARTNPSAWAYLMPILEENGGWVGFNSTPLGNNHFKRLCEFARREPGWFHEKLTNDDTSVYTGAQLDNILRELQAIHGPDYGLSLFKQEYFCSFDAAILGSIWGDCIRVAYEQGRVSRIPYKPGLPVFTAWDLGFSDDTAIWFYQFNGKYIDVIDYHESNHRDIEFYGELLRAKQRELHCSYGRHWLPHDARARTQPAGGRSIHWQMINQKVGPVAIAKRLDHEEGIQAARATFPFCRFDAAACELGLDALKHYHHVWDDDNKVFSTLPAHDWSSHGSSAFRTLALSWKRPMDARPDAPVVERHDDATIHAGVTFGALKKKHFARRKREREMRMT